MASGIDERSARHSDAAPGKLYRKAPAGQFVGTDALRHTRLAVDLAADALELSGASRAEPVEYDGIRERHLPEIDIRGKNQQHKSHYTLRAVAMIRAGVAPDLEAQVSWWSADDLLVWALYALLAYVRVAADRTGQPVDAICQRLAANHGIELSAHT